MATSLGPAVLDGLRAVGAAQVLIAPRGLHLRIQAMRARG